MRLSLVNQNNKAAWRITEVAFQNLSSNYRCRCGESIAQRFVGVQPSAAGDSPRPMVDADKSDIDSPEKILEPWLLVLTL